MLTADIRRNTSVRLCEVFIYREFITTLGNCLRTISYYKYDIHDPHKSMFVNIDTFASYQGCEISKPECYV